ncbi:MAG: hypothetical protein ACU837_13980 [Gammaproteobacteria bacterium]
MKTLTALFATCEDAGEALMKRGSSAGFDIDLLFDTILRENPAAGAGQAREVWHFVKPLRSTQPTRYLDGIQQLQG